jgi:hypothetical protein
MMEWYRPDSSGTGQGPEGKSCVNMVMDQRIP